MRVGYDIYRLELITENEKTQMGFVVERPCCVALGPAAPRKDQGSEVLPQRVLRPFGKGLAGHIALS